jgi:predicted transcriptional regulator
MKPKGKPKTPPTTEEQQTIVTMSASGLSQSKIAQIIGRSRHMVKNALAEPEIQRAVKDEKAELAQLYREKARDIVSSISSADIEDASLQQKAVSSGILLDKSLLLTGDMPNINVQVLLDVAHAIRDKERGRRVLPSQAPALPAPEPEP